MLGMHYNLELVKADTYLQIKPPVPPNHILTSFIHF